MNTPSDELQSHWSSQGLAISCGNDSASIVDAERRLACTFPNEFRLYLANLNGMLEGIGTEQDQEGYSFWPLRRMRSVADEAIALGSRGWSEYDGADRDILFADYMVWCWAFAIRVAPSPEYGCVYAIGQHPSARLVARSFAEFVSLYIVDAEHLYPDGPYCQRAPN